ncbi:lyase family protein [Streptomyces sp. NPDC058612]|uniref:lyase family protein n=1 Tax=Streptomyces sp. NPDC058612 TaxID=3346555 RepID=UPI00364DD4BF
MAAGDAPVSYPAHVYEEARSLGPDSYPSRALYGWYLMWVFDRLVESAPAHIAVMPYVQAAVSLAAAPDGSQTVTLTDGTLLSDVDAVVLALGHLDMPLTAEEQELASFAESNGLAYVPTGNPAEAALQAVSPGQHVALRGMGLNFFDHMALLSVGRGGSFHRCDGALRYRRSGREPVMFAGSRRGVPYHARGANQKGVAGRVRPLFLTEAVIASLRARREAGEPVGFLRDLWPLIDREVRAVYYRALIARHSGLYEADAFLTEFAKLPLDGAQPAEADALLLERFGVGSDLRWDWADITRPYGDRQFASSEEFRHWSAAMVLAAGALDRIDGYLCEVGEALARIAAEHARTPMAGRTLTQHAVPVTFGLKGAGWLTLVLDASDRVRQVRSSLGVQLGGAAGTLAAYLEYARVAGIDPAGHASALTAAFADELGLRAPEVPWHSVRTPLADIGWAAVAVTGGLGKFAVDVLGMSRTEVAEVSEPGEAGTGVSSAMPQKRNPVLATLLVSAARQAPALSLMLGQSLVAEDERSAGGWQAEWQPLREALRLTEGSARTAVELAEGIQVHAERLRHNLSSTDGAIVSERLNVALAPVLGKAAAKQLLARVARQAAHTGRRFGELLTEAPEFAGDCHGDPPLLTADQLRDLLIPASTSGPRKTSWPAYSGATSAAPPQPTGKRNDIPDQAGPVRDCAPAAVHVPAFHSGGARLAPPAGLARGHRGSVAGCPVAAGPLCEVRTSAALRHGRPARGPFLRGP